MRTAYKHCHLIIDDRREYLDGSIIVNDEYIEDVFMHTKEFNESDLKIVDLHGKILMPSFFDSKSDDKEDRGVNHKYIFSKTELSVPTHLYTEKELEYVGQNTHAVTMQGPYKKLFTVKTLSSPLNKINIFADGVSDITVTRLLSFDPINMLNHAMNNKCYVEFGIDNTISDEHIKFIMKNIDSDKLALIGYNHDSFINQIKRLHKLNVSLNNIVAMSSLNALRFYNEDTLEGSLIKGKYANIICLDDKLNIEFVLNKGAKDA